MTFIQRVQNMLYFFFSTLHTLYVIEPNYKPFVHRHFGSDVHYMELFQSADIWLMRNDFTFEFPRPTMPNVVYMSGFQCKPSKLMFDQADKLFRMKARGVAKVLDIATVNKENFLEALKEVLYQTSYREKMKELSSIQRDQPMKPLDRAMFWIEFVMRHKGAAHLRTESYKMSSIQYYSMDVAAFLLAVILLVFTIFVSAVKFLLRKLFYRNKVKKE